MSTNIAIAYQLVEKFNTVAGNLARADLDSIASQLEFIKEELDETCEAFFDHDAVELVDGACDLFVTVAGLMQKLQVNGVDIEKALSRVNDNNLSKFPLDRVFAKDRSICPAGAVVEHTPYGHVVFKRESDGKVIKPTNFTAVDITDCVPKDFFGVDGEV